jgi:hypothetical protein
MSEDSQQIEQLKRFLFTEEAAKYQLNNSKEARNLRAVQKNLLTQIQDAGKSGDVAFIVETEKTVLQGDLDRYANSSGMASSLKTALSEFAVIEQHLAIVDDKNQYRLIDKGHSLPRNREKGLPLDEARQAFKSHYARLSNLDKSRLSDDDKKVIDARKTNIFNAINLYIQRQARTLGIEGV